MKCYFHIVRGSELRIPAGIFNVRVNFCYYASHVLLYRKSTVLDVGRVCRYTVAFILYRCESCRMHVGFRSIGEWNLRRGNYVWCMDDPDLVGVGAR